MELLASVPLLIIDDLGMRKLAPTAAEELLEIVMRRSERASTLLDFQPPGRGLGRTCWRQCRRHRHAGPPAAPPRTHPEMRATELANKNGLASEGETKLKAPSPGSIRWPVLP